MGRHLTLFAGFFLILTALGCPREVPAPEPEQESPCDACASETTCIDGECVPKEVNELPDAGVPELPILNDAGPAAPQINDAGQPAGPILGEGECLTGYNHCGEEEFCFVNGCGDGLLGVCTEIPEDCESAMPMEVCGCNGLTYYSLCEAQRYAMNVAGPHACPTQPAPDGGSMPMDDFDCSVETQCSEGEFDNGLGLCVTDKCAEGFQEVELFIANSNGTALGIPASCFGPWPETACFPLDVLEDDCPAGQHNNGTGECEYDCRPDCGHSFVTNPFSGNQYEPQYCHNAYRKVRTVAADAGVQSYCMPKFGTGCKPETGEYCMGGCQGRGFCTKAENSSDCQVSSNDLVCTCNGNTSTRCTAWKNNVDTYGGACPDWQPTPQSCGGPDNVACPAGQKCNIVGCNANTWGQCQDTPDPEDPCSVGCMSGGLFGNPECGCDGVTYASACHRRVAGVAKDPAGSCGDNDGPQEGNSCDPTDENACDDSSPTYCMGEGADGGFVFDQMECTPSFVQSATGCPPGLNCWRQYPRTLFCKKPIGDCEGTSGICRHWPGADILGCSLFGEVVSCGCNGQTYSHTCYADKDMVGVDHYGACPALDGGTGDDGLTDIIDP